MSVGYVLKLRGKNMDVVNNLFKQKLTEVIKSS